ncbi:hypothetical protein BG011_004067 [Mortierella polycephala]|uniref:F-box domain-containing protein n=1 Tax=Mortierella polycephala TaxID=41804 RepID=A0A9P6U254_9FUNG|nr:hypothetical protein BG011_004067 [Mortierella polycephala]
MNLISDLVQTTAGIAMDNLSYGQQMNFQKDTALSKKSTMPPEIIQLIIDYLDDRDLVKVLTLSWTWALLVAPKLWQDIRYTANSNRIVFLITKSVVPQSPCQQAPTPASMRQSTADTYTTSSSSATAAQSSPQGTVPGPKRRNSYPWPTLLPYHTMVQSLHVSLSNAGMVQDLLEMIPCCSELRSFSIQSVISTEDLLIRGAIASANNDLLDPLDLTQGHAIHPSGSSASLASLASMASQCSHSGACYHSHAHSLILDPFNRTMTPRAELQQADDETTMASSTSQTGMLLSLLANSCSKLERIWFSGFHPVFVLGSPTDLRPRPPKFDFKLFQDQSQELYPSAQSMTGVQPPLAAIADDRDTNARLPPLPHTPSINTASATTPVPPVPGMNLSAVTASNLPVPVSDTHAVSKVQSIQFVNCTLSPQYLLTMIRHSLPNLKEIHLTQCWPNNPLQGPFLLSLSKTCPGLKAITLHGTQSHRGIVTSEHVLRMLQNLEGGSRCDSNDRFSRTGRQGIIRSLAALPLGTFSKSLYNAPSVSSTGATAGGSSSSSNSNSSSSSALVTLPSSMSSGSDMTNSSTNHFYHGNTTEQQGQDSLDGSSSVVTLPPSDLEALSVWFTHSILDQAIVTELGNRDRHPRLQRVEFGSEEAFDVGENLIRELQQCRPGLDVVWTNYGDTGDDRED